MLEGEILVREGKLDDGINQLRNAVKVEDSLHYGEPPDLILTVRTFSRSEPDCGRAVR
jgi:hypothetical protein